MAVVDPNLEWLGYVQPVGLVLSPAILDRYGLVPEEQTRADGDAVAACFASDGEGAGARRSLGILLANLGAGARHQVAGLPSAQPLPVGLSVAIDEADTILEPHWAVIDPESRPTLLLRFEQPGVAPDQRGALSGWEATPHQRFERLLRENEAGVRTGILLTDDQLRLVYAPKGETSGWLSFPLRALATVAGRPMLGGLKLALNAFRLNNDTPERRLPALLKQSRDAQAEVSAKLAEQVLGSLHQVLRGLYAADEARIARLAAQRPDHLYGGLLTVLLRLVFLLYAEDRGLIPSATDGEMRHLYDQGYGVRALHAKLTADAARYPDTMEERRGAWARLLVLFRLVHNGGSGGFIMGRGGDLFDPTVYPFLLGQGPPSDPIAPAPVSDGCILGVLDKLLVLDGERLSYRTLDVEQIGSVYETVMGFTVETLRGRALALRGGKNDNVPIFIDLAELAALKGSERQKQLKDSYDVKLPDKVAKAVEAAKTASRTGSGAETACGRARVARRDARAGRRAAVAADGRAPPYRQPLHAAHLDRADRTPCAGAGFRAVGARSEAGSRAGAEGVRPGDGLRRVPGRGLPATGGTVGEGLDALARDAPEHPGRRGRRVACQAPRRSALPLRRRQEPARGGAGEALALARDACARARVHLPRPCAQMRRQHCRPRHQADRRDALGCVEARPAAVPQIRRGSRRWGDEGAQRNPIRAGRHAARSAGAETQAGRRSVELVRVLGDAVISAFFAEAKPKAREKHRATIESLVTGIGEAKWDELRAAAASLRTGEHPVKPFHWAIEFPEVFGGEKPGFDAIVGNPPFLGGTNISGSLGDRYLSYLKESAEGAGNRSDLVSYFFQRTFSLLSSSGAAGLVATNTISQGDTREAAPMYVLRHGGSIYRVIKRFTWPGEAAVIVSIVHFSKTKIAMPKFIDGEAVDSINSFLLNSIHDGSPRRLARNLEKTYKGLDIYGSGFLFDDTDKSGASNALALMGQIQTVRPESEARIFPYIGGHEVNSDPTHTPHRYVFDINDLDEFSARQQFPELIGNRRTKDQTRANEAQGQR